MKIMIVDDEKDVEILFRQQFRKEVRDGKVQLCYAFSGEEALEYLETVKPPTWSASSPTSTCRGSPGSTC